MVYRREIDGLRAVAVIPVLFFHAGFQHFSGGFVGVDVFFVISGFLITSIILSEKEAGSFSLLKFYERRARRILPALFVVMLACLPFAWLWMPPYTLAYFSKSLIAVSLFLSNLLFWKETGYFASDNEFTPLLHTWSLAVEEQYYLLFPIFLLIAWQLGKKWMMGALCVLAIASLALSEWATQSYASTSFYWLPTRGWELLIGALVAFYLFPKRATHQYNKGITAQLGSVVGLMLILLSVFMFNKLMSFPGLNALIPTLGAALIILFANQHTFIGKLLGSKLLVGIGLISYSTYLWHQPIFSFARYATILSLSKLDYILLIGIAFLLAYFTWKWIETPFRNKNVIKREQLTCFGLIGSLFFIVVGLIGYFNHGFEKRFDMPASLASSFGLTDRAERCFDRSDLHNRSDWLCDIGSDKAHISFVAYGDSHSKSLFDAFDKAAIKANEHGAFTGASYCTPLLGIYILRNDQAEKACDLVNKRMFEYVKTNKISKVFLVSRWSVYTDGGYDGTEATWIGISQNDARNQISSRQAFETGLKKTVEAYASIGTKLYIIAQVPQQKFAVKDLYYKIYAHGLEYDNSNLNENIRLLSVSKLQHTKLQSYNNALFNQHAEAGQLKVIDLQDAFCKKEECLIGNDKQSFYFDNNHLSTEGGMLTIDTLAKYIKTDQENPVSQNDLRGDKT